MATTVASCSASLKNYTQRILENALNAIRNRMSDNILKNESKLIAYVG